MIQFSDGINEIQHVQRSAAEVAEEQAKDKVWSEVIKWVEAGQVAEKAQNRGKSREVLVAKSIFDPEVFKMRDGLLMFTKATNLSMAAKKWQIYLP